MIPYLTSPAGYDRDMQRARLDAIGQLNRERFALTFDAEIEARIASYELAFRMQSAAPELLDFSKETPATLEMYGVNQGPSHAYAVNCLLARRMVERGVRFVLVSHGSWDDHNDLDKNLKQKLRHHGQARRRPCQGPETARAARFDRRDLGWRIRPHSDDAAAAPISVMAGTIIRTATACGWQEVASATVK